MLEAEPLQIKEDMTYQELQVKILDRKEQVLRRRTILYVKVQWSKHLEREATWELVEELKKKYTFLF